MDFGRRSQYGQRNSQAQGGARTGSGHEIMLREFNASSSDLATASLVSFSSYPTSGPGPEEYSSAYRSGDEERSRLLERYVPVNTNWDPPYLRWPTLAAFAVFFGALVTALQVVYLVSVQHTGIATSDDGKRWIWTYGPTALLVLVTVVWRKVDFAAKSIQPWAEMAKGPTGVDRSLLLDYVTPFQLAAIWSALRNRHWVVAATITAFFLLKALTIVSTGLFSLESVPVAVLSTPMVLNNSFTGANYDVDSVDSTSTYTVYGVQTLNLSHPAGTTDVYAVQQFSPQTYVADSNNSSTHAAVVDVFSANLECESGTLTYTNATDELVENAPVAQYYNTSVSTSDCQVHNAHLDAPSWYGNGTFFGYYGQIQAVICSNLAISNPMRNRIMVAIAYSRRDSYNDNAMLASGNIICSPTYAMQAASVTLDYANNVQDVQLSDAAPRNLSGVSAFQIGEGVIGSLDAAQLILSTETNFNISYDVFFQLMSGSIGNPRDFLNTTTLQTSSQALFSKVAAQVANKYLLGERTSSDTEFLGSISVTKQRLFVRSLPLRIMQGISSGILLLVLVVICLVPRKVVPRSPDSLAAIVAILSRSPALARQLKDTGHLSLDALRTILLDSQFYTKVHHDYDVPTFCIMMETDSLQEMQHEFRRNPVGSKVQWVRPFILGYVANAIIILGPIVLLVALQITLSSSDAHDGLGDTSAESLFRYTWLYAPTLVLVLVGTLFNVLDFEVEFSEPYLSLSKDYCDAKSSMFQDPLRKISIHTTWEALRRGRIALLAASLSVLLAPFLTIIVSGLFLVEPVPLISPMNVTAVNWFNTTGIGSDDVTTGDNPALVTSLIVQGNMSFPAWTYEELALPQIALSSQSNSSTNRTTGSISITMPAVRGHMNCTQVPESLIVNITVAGDFISTNVSTPDGCGNSGYGEFYSSLTNNFYAPSSGSGFFGQTLDIGFSDGCPPLAVWFGQITDEKVDSVTVLLCTPSLDRVSVNASFTLPDLSIPTSTPPTVYPNTEAHFSDWYPNALASDFQSVNISGSQDTAFDTFFSAIVYGRDGVPAAQLAANATLLIDSMTHVFRQYAAQVVNTAFRQDLDALPKNETDVPSILSGTYTNPERTRLFQNELSTRLLQGVLAGLCCCAVVVAATLGPGGRTVLPKPVGSIGAVCSLLAGGKLVGVASGDNALVPLGAEWWSDDEWKKRRLWRNGESFRMGWWDGDDVENTSPAGQDVAAHREFRIDVKLADPLDVEKDETES